MFVKDIQFSVTENVFYKRIEIIYIVSPNLIFAISVWKIKVKQW